MSNSWCIDNTKAQHPQKKKKDLKKSDSKSNDEMRTFFCSFKIENEINKCCSISRQDVYTACVWCDANQQFFFSLWRLEYHNQATWESGVASMMQNSKFFFLFSCFFFFLLKPQVPNVVTWKQHPLTLCTGCCCAVPLKESLKGVYLRDFEEQGSEILSVIYFFYCNDRKASY